MTDQHENLDEDTAGRRSRVLAEADGLEARPRESIRVQEVGEELRHVSQLVGLQPTGCTYVLENAKSENGKKKKSKKRSKRGTAGGGGGGESGNK